MKCWQKATVEKCLICGPTENTSSCSKTNKMELQSITVKSHETVEFIYLFVKVISNLTEDQNRLQKTNLYSCLLLSVHLMAQIVNWLWQLSYKQETKAEDQPKIVAKMGHGIWPPALKFCSQFSSVVTVPPLPTMCSLSEFFSTAEILWMSYGLIRQNRHLAIWCANTKTNNVFKQARHTSANKHANIRTELFAYA